MKKSVVLIIVLITIYIIICQVTQKLRAEFFARERVFFVEERIILRNLTPDTNNLRIWVPYPVNDGWQTISDFKLVSSFDDSFIVDKDYKNKIIYLNLGQDILDESTSEIILSFKVKRKEYRASFDSKVADKTLSRFLKPSRLVPVNGRIKNLAKKITQGKSNDLERVRAIYDYIIDELTYSKDDPKVCGIGNSLLTLEVKKGICTDYHSLFISLVRSLGIPAKFEIGFRIPQDISQGKLNGYHCWAKFYLKGKGWIPVDISEADKHPERRNYFFGRIDENRIHLTTGRDIKLKYTKNSQPLNFFVYPYAELDGKESDNIDIEVWYKNLKGGG